MDERTSVRANERTKTAAKVAAAKEEKEEKKARDSRRRRSLLGTTRTLRGSASVVLVPSSHYPIPKRTNKREIGLPPFSLSLALSLSHSSEHGGRKRTSEKRRRSTVQETPRERKEKKNVERREKRQLERS